LRFSKVLAPCLDPFQMFLLVVGEINRTPPDISRSKDEYGKVDPIPVFQNHIPPLGVGVDDGSHCGVDDPLVVAVVFVSKRHQSGGLQSAFRRDYHAKTSKEMSKIWARSD